MKKTLTVQELINTLALCDSKKLIYLSCDPEGNNMLTIGGGSFLITHTIQKTEKGNYILFPLEHIEVEET